jgi:hypothetical protein
MKTPVLLFAFVAIACARTEPMPPGNPGGIDGASGPLMTSGKDASVDGPTGVACGSATCGPGLVCCNASCGICTPPSSACIQIACDPKRDAAAGSPCKTADDCRLFDDYCTGCDCRALAKTDPDPKCASRPVQCLRQPCADKVPACVQGKCALADKPR